jgi:hypothetical protein
METSETKPLRAVPLQRLVRRLRAACRTHDTQVSACILLSGPQVIAAIMSDAPWWVCVLVALIWPAVAFMANFANPIPPNH